MKFSPRARLLLATVMILTLGIKAGWARALRPSDAVLFGARADGLLRSSGFDTRRHVHPIGVIVYGSRGDCRLMVAEYEPSGTYADLLTIFARPIGPLRYVWRGQLSAAPPRLLPLTEQLVQRQLQRFAVTPERHPVAAVAASAGCALDRLPWERLAALPR